MKSSYFFCGASILFNPIFLWIGWIGLPQIASGTSGDSQGPHERAIRGHVPDARGRDEMVRVRTMDLPAKASVGSTKNDQCQGMVTYGSVDPLEKNTFPPKKLNHCNHLFLVSSNGDRSKPGNPVPV